LTQGCGCRRVRFLTLYVWFDHGVPVEVSRVEPSLVAFDDDGRRDRAEADREHQAAINLLDEAVFGPAEPEVIPAAARFQTAGFRWKPTRADLDAALAVHGLRHTSD
jgi:hypothetical protein